MPYDANITMQSLVTKTTSFSSTAVDLGTGTPRRGLKARFLIPSYISATTSGTVFTPSIEHSSDNTTFTTLVSGNALTGGTAAVTTALPQWLPFSTRKRYVRSVVTLTSTTGSPSITWQADLGIAEP